MKMPRLLRRVFLGLLVVVVALPCGLLGYSYAFAWHQRRVAEKLLGAVRDMRPGVTTRAEYEAALRPLVGRLERPFVVDDARGHETRMSDGYGVGAGLGLIGAGLSWIQSIRPPSGMFTVFPDFRDGVLESLRLEESGEALGHPPGATVSLRTQRFRDEGAVFLDERGGYWYRRMAVGADTGPAYEQFVEMDERATKAQRDAALAFDFGCFTSLHGCRDGGEMLRPLGEPQ